MASFLAAIPKRTNEIDLVGPLKNTLSSIYPNYESLGINESLEALNKLRKEATVKVDYRSEIAAEKLQKYYDALTFLEAKCPPSEVQIAFKWKDSVGTSSFLGSSSFTHPSIAYEKACVLFNLAVCQTQIAASTLSETIKNDLALKQAAKFYCSASGIFQALKHIVPSAVGNHDVTLDLQGDVLQVLHMVMLSQAQEAFFYKAANDNMKDAIIARIASQCEEYYTETLNFMQVLKSPFPLKDWQNVVATKSGAFKGIAEYHQACVCGTEQNFGEQLTRLMKSIECLKTEEAKGGFFSTTFKYYLQRATQALQEAEKDNEFIYHARKPDYNTLSPVGKAVLAKPTPIPDRFMPDQPDLFAKLLPVGLQQAAAKLEVSKQELVNKEIATIREMNQFLDATLASMNLPAALEDKGGLEVPASLKQKAQAIREKGGMAELEKKLIALPELLQRNKEILDETERMINKEIETDTKLKEQFKERWNRVPSEQLCQSFRDNISKYRTIIQNAIDADEKVKRKFLAHKENIRLLESSEQELAKSLPSGGGGAAGTPAAVKLGHLMTRVEALKNERAVIESELQGSTFTDLKAKFLQALSGDRAINESALATESLGEVYGPLQKQVRESKSRQEELLAEIRAANEEFVKSKGSSSNSNRESVLSNLAAAHGAYNELMANLKEGTKFYDDLTQLLLNLQSKVNDFCFARKTEQEGLVSDLQKSIANSTNPPPPTVPAYHTPTTSAPQPTPPSTAGQSTYPGYPTYNPYAYFPPPPLPMGYNPYAPQPYNTFPGYPTPPQQPPPQNYPYPQQPTHGYPQYPPASK